MEWVCILGWMEELMKGLGKIIICTAKGFTPGVMAGNMMESIIWIKSMDMEFITGQTVGDMKATGLMGSNMVKGNTFSQMGLPK